LHIVNDLHLDIYADHGYISYDGIDTLQYGKNGTMFECTTCLTDQHGRPLPETVGYFHGMSYEQVECATNALLHALEADTYYTQGSYEDGIPGMTDWLFLWRDDDVLEDEKSHPVLEKFHEYSELIAGYYSNPNKSLVPLETLHRKTELYAAHLMARLPILTVMAAEEQLPRVTRDAEGENGKGTDPRITITLSVEWPFVISVLAGINLFQWVAVVAVIWYCRRKNVYMRDEDSYLSVARIRRSSMNQIDGGSGLTGEQLAKVMEKQGIGMRYGARRVDLGRARELYELDMLDEVGYPLGEQFPHNVKYI